MKLHSLSPEMKSTFNQMRYPGENSWNIENSSILLSLKTGLVFNALGMMPMPHKLYGPHNAISFMFQLTSSKRNQCKELEIENCRKSTNGNRCDSILPL